MPGTRPATGAGTGPIIPGALADRWNIAAVLRVWGPTEARIGLHAIVQEPDGTWLSKMGNNCLIRIRHPLDIAGTEFGQPLAVFARRRGPA